MKNSTRPNGIDTFTESLITCACRYACGRHSYIITIAEEIAQNYYDKMSDTQKESLSFDINRELLHHIKTMPFHFEIRRTTGDDLLRPLDAVLNFVRTHGNGGKIDCLRYYVDISYDANKDEYEFSERTEKDPRDYLYSTNDIDDLLVWDTLASVLDVKNHRMLVTKDGKECRVCRVWKHKCVPSSFGEGFYVYDPLVYEPAWLDVETYLKPGGYGYAIAADSDSIAALKEIKK